MTTARADVVALLDAACAAAYPDPDDRTRPLVSGRAAPVDPPVTPVVVVLSAGVEPANVACPVRAYRLAVTAAVPAVDADDALDALRDVIHDAHDVAGAEWDDVTRGTFRDTLPAYQLTVKVTE